jgi:hypothetical protein
MIHLALADGRSDALASRRRTTAEEAGAFTALNV